MGYKHVVGNGASRHKGRLILGYERSEQRLESPSQNLEDDFVIHIT